MRDRPDQPRRADGGNAPRLTDVARVARLSAMTVSRALREPE